MEVKRAKIAINLTCCHCIFFKRMKAPQFEDRCSKLGTQGADLPCRSFAQNYNLLNLEEDGYADIANALRKLEGNKLAMLAALINKEAGTRKFGYKFGQPVYTKIEAEDYLDSYVKVRVVSANKHYIYVSGQDELKGMLLHSGVLTRKEFLVIRNKLKAAKRIHAPSRKVTTKKLPALANEAELSKMREAVDDMFSGTPIDVEDVAKPKRTRKRIVKDGMTTVGV